MCKKLHEHLTYTTFSLGFSINCLFNFCVSAASTFDLEQYIVHRVLTSLEPVKQSESQTNNMNGEYLQLYEHISDTFSYAFTTCLMVASVQS